MEKLNEDQAQEMVNKMDNHLDEVNKIMERFCLAGYRPEIDPAPYLIITVWKPLK
jgi:hypothetical protein